MIMSTYRFFKTAFYDDDNSCESFDISIYKKGISGCVTTGGIVSFKQAKNRSDAGWWCFGSIAGNRLPETKEIAQSTARKIMGRCPIRFYEKVKKKRWGKSRPPTLKSFIVSRYTEKL